MLGPACHQGDRAFPGNAYLWLERACLYMRSFDSRKLNHCATAPVV